MLRRIRIALACCCFALTVCAFTFWIRGEHYADSLKLIGGGKEINLVTGLGRVTLAYWTPPAGWIELSARGCKVETAPVSGTGRNRKNDPDFRFLWRLPDLALLSVPNWLITVAAGVLTILLKPKPRFKFSVRELLVLTTFAAVVMGALITLLQFAVVVSSVKQ